MREGHIKKLGPEPLALYLLLLCVGNQHGLSYYSDKTAAGLLSMSPAALKQARARLVDAGLIAFQAPLYQVLSLDPPPSPETCAPPRNTEAKSAAEILQALLLRAQDTQQPKKPSTPSSHSPS